MAATVHPSPSLARRRPRGFLRHVAVFLAAGVAVAVGAASGAPRGDAGRAVALASALGARGLVVAPDDVVWVDTRPGVLAAAYGTARAIVRASPAKGEPSDIHLVATRLSPEGVLLEVGGTYNLSQTAGADEGRPLVRGLRVAYVSRGLSYEAQGPAADDEAMAAASASVHVLDLGARPEGGADWTSLERMQSAVTSYQETGQLAGIRKSSYILDPPPRELAVSLDEEALVLRADGRDARIPFAAGAAAPELPAWVRVDAGELARPGNLVTWAVDRVRNVPWIGDEAMQTVKAVAFTALDFVLRNTEEVTGDTGEDTIAEDFGQSPLDPPVQAIPTDPEIGWPPPPLEPWVTPALAGEGQWNSLDKDPFVRQVEGLPSIFVTTFIRSDRTRKATRVYVALWDPRQIELHMMAGTVEPKSATGEAGPGLIPRTPEVMKRVVAASNSGFQALHGEFGMMADGVVYLPPKPYAATVAVLRDGSTAFGTWPVEPAIPESVRSYRQNMTVMVLDEKWNPYGRTWWGGTPPGWADKTHTVRTGMCLTREHFVAYFYGTDIGPESLSQAMIQTRCVFGIALDMNAGHSGLEFYKVAPAAELEPLGRPVHTDWEAEGDVSGLDGYRFRGRRFIRGMGLMNFPRYIRREARDFMYMTLRPMLPGKAIPIEGEPAFAGEGAWRVKGLPQHGFPYALATSEVRGPASSRLRVLGVDPRMVSAAPAGAAIPAGASTVAVLDAGEGARASLFWSSAAFSIADAPPVPDAIRLAGGATEASLAVAAAGIRDDDGMLFYVELEGPPAEGDAAAPGVPTDLFQDVLTRLGCGTHVFLDRSLAIALGGDTSLGGTAVHPPMGPYAVRLLRAQAPGGRRIFPDTPIVPLDTWYPLQQKRIRYFKKAAKPEEAGGEAPP